MYPDVVDLRGFYESETGGLARRLIRAGLRGLWPNVAGLTLAGFGFATPYLRPFREEARGGFALMPAPQGVTGWPAEEPNATALVEETALPLADDSVDRLLIVHALEHTGHAGAVLGEAWRVLAGNGRLVAAVPHRGGLWAMAQHNPFGYGFSFSSAHIRRLLSHSRFQVERVARCGFVPPFLRGLPPASVEWVERFGARLVPALAGMLLVEASKQVYARPRAQRARIPALAPLPGMAEPSPSAG